MVIMYPYTHDVKNIPVFLYLVIIFQIFFIAPRIRCEENPAPPKKGFPYTFSVTPIVGLLYGQGKEIVYKDNYNDSYLSELKWDIKSLVYFGSTLDVFRTNPREKPGFAGSLSMKFGLPMGTGLMEDRDWDPKYKPDGSVSHFSSSAAQIDTAYMLDLLAGASLPLRSGIVVFNPYLGLSYMRFKWAAYNGYYDYTLENGDQKQGTFTGLAVAYSQDWLLFFAGLSASFYVLPKTAITVSFQGSPLISYTGEDDHYMRTGSSDPGQFRDRIETGVYLEPGLKFVYSPTERLSVGFNMSWRYIQGRPHGHAYGRPTGQDKEGRFLALGSVSGAEFQALDTGISFTIRF